MPNGTFGRASGMEQPGRSYNGIPYPYAFNGKRMENVELFTTNIYDYGMRNYDARIGRFYSIDPLTGKYPELTPYQFASNRPIDGIDLDGEEYLKYIPKFSYHGKWYDYAFAIDNGAINIANTVPAVWNSGVATVQSIGRGTYFSDIGNELKQIGLNVKNWAVNSYNYTFGTPIKQQFVDAGKTLADPRTLELVTTLYLGAKIPLGEGKGNLLESKNSQELLSNIAKSAEKEFKAVNSIVERANNAIPGLKYQNLGSATYEEAILAGEKFVGQNATRVIGEKGTLQELISKDELKRFRPPRFKVNLQKVQANFETRPNTDVKFNRPERGRTNAHLDIIQ